MANPHQLLEPLPDKGSHVIGAAVAAIVVSTIAVILRCYSKSTAKAGFWWDDWLIIISLPFTWALIGLEIGWVSAGLGKHIWSPGVQPSIGLKLLFASDIVYDTSITFIRLSVVLFYYRIFGIDRWFRIALWVSAGILVAWWIAISILAIFQCHPIARQWNYSIPGHCYSFYGTFMGVTIPNIFVDLLILVLPLPMLWRLQMDMKKKILLTANFMLGYCVIIVTIIRLLSIIRVPANAIEDVTWNSVTCAILFMIEPAVATVSICLPSIRSLVIHGFKHFPSTSFRTFWSKRSGTPVSSGRRSEESRSTPITRSRAVIKRSNSSDDANTDNNYCSTDISENGSPFSERSSLALRKPEEAKALTDESIELEVRVRDYYDKASFDQKSRDAVQQHWNSEADVEMGERNS